jgi:plastocyanin
MTRWLRLLGVLFAFGLVLAACSSDDSGDEASDSAGDDGGSECDGDICLSGTQYVPSDLTVAVGDTVTWASVDSPDHTVTADDDSFDSGTLSNGDTFEETFDEAGEFAYHCEIHSSMTGTITVE